MCLILLIRSISQYSVIKWSFRLAEADLYISIEVNIVLLLSFVALSLLLSLSNSRISLWSLGDTTFNKINASQENLDVCCNW